MRPVPGIARELNRGGSTQRHYDARHAQAQALKRARLSAANNAPAKPPELWRRVRRWLRRDWSPEQIWGRAQRFKLPTVTPPAIYAYVEQERGTGGDLHEHLRYVARRWAWRQNIAAGLPRSRPCISERPRDIAKRAQTGHWEGDSILRARASGHRLVALVERHSRYLRLKRPPREGALSRSVADTVIHALKRLLLHSITFDNGTEFAGYKTMVEALGCQVYLADPYRPGQRGTCENTIGLVPQYVPRGTCGAHKSIAQIQAIADKLNQRPRKCLGYLTSHEVLFNKIPVALRT